MVVPFSDSLFSSVGAPFSYLVMLRFLHIVGNLLWFDALATTRKHEFEPPPNTVRRQLGWMRLMFVGSFLFFSLEDKAVLTDGAVDTIKEWKIYKRGERGVIWPSNKQQQ